MSRKEIILVATVQYDPLAPSFLADPYPTYAGLREDDPVHWSDGMGGWVLTRYEHVALALSDPRFSVADRPPMRRNGRARTMVTADPPEHTRLRKLVKSFRSRSQTSSCSAQAVTALRRSILFQRWTSSRSEAAFKSSS